MDRVEVFYVQYWKGEEKLDAVENEDFFNNVKSVMEADLQMDSSPKAKKAKFYFAGVSAK